MPKEPKKKKYYIVEGYDSSGDKCWVAHTGFWPNRGVFASSSAISETTCWQKYNAGPDDCERKLRKILKTQVVEPIVVRVLEI